MKIKNLLLMAVLAVFFAGCEKKEPFDTQSPDDEPLILIPYETKTGQINLTVESPETPLVDSVVVTPSRYTTVHWYLDGELVHTGEKINMCFPAGKYDLIIEAVTQAGKSTRRTGTLTVKPGDSDPYSEAPSIGYRLAAAKEATLSGKHLDKIEQVLITTDVFAKNVLHTITPNYKEAGFVKINIPAMEDGYYFVRMKAADGTIYGSESIHVYNVPVILDGYDVFSPMEEWTISGINMLNVASVTVDETVIAVTSATETSVTLMAPDVPQGTTHTLSVQDKSGSAVLIATRAGTVTSIETACTDQITIWKGPVTLDWNSDLIQVEPANMTDIAVGDTMYIYFDKDAAEYYQMRITIPDWTADYHAQTDMTDEPSPFMFVFDDNCRQLANQGKKMCVVGWGLTINKVTYKAVEK